jgi:hypothetical protein
MFLDLILVRKVVLPHRERVQGLKHLIAVSLVGVLHLIPLVREMGRNRIVGLRDRSVTLLMVLQRLREVFVGRRGLMGRSGVRSEIALPLGDHDSKLWHLGPDYKFLLDRLEHALVCILKCNVLLIVNSHQLLVWIGLRGILSVVVVLTDCTA